MIPAAFREAGPADAAAIAALHAASWRATYRGILGDAFLDGAVDADRAALWRARLAGPGRDRMLVLLADHSAALAGFACVLLDEEPAWGAVLDNLHVRPALKRRGLGRALLGRAAGWTAARAPETALNLLLYEGNDAAARFYESLGAAFVERVAERAPDGRELFSLRFRWNDPAALAARLSVGR